MTWAGDLPFLPRAGVSRRGLARVALVSVSLLLLVWLFVGIELVRDEHDMKYDVFAKQHPTLRMTFRNPVTCLVCDTKPYERLTPRERAEFGAFCRYRFGLEDPRDCYAIFAEQQRRADQSSQNPASAR
jgi:hypothetical protein